MKIRFWGTRGSLPVSLTAHDVRSKLLDALGLAAGRDLRGPGAIEAFVDSLDFTVAGTYGGHSSCVQVDIGSAEHVILDMGSGLRPMGQHMLQRHGPQPQTYHVFQSHLHWDHIMGLPFFTPAYIAGNRIIVHSCHSQVESALRRQQDPPSFPVGFGHFGAAVEFDLMQPGQTCSIAGMQVTAHRQRHSGDSYGWRFDIDGKRLVYTTDSEHRIEQQEERQGFVDFFQSADAVIFDAMYSLADAISMKADWGHSSNIMGVELCQAARVGTLVMFHHEPSYSDRQIHQVLEETRRYERLTREDHALAVISAWDGLELDL